MVFNVKVKLKPGNKLRADAGAMNYMDSNISIIQKQVILEKHLEEFLVEVHFFIIFLK